MHNCVADSFFRRIGKSVVSVQEQNHLQHADEQNEQEDDNQYELDHGLSSLTVLRSAGFQFAVHTQFIARISAWRKNVQLPPLHIADACRGILKILPGIKVLNVYWISTRFSTKVGASGSAVGTGKPAPLVPALPQPALVHLSQLVRSAPLVVFTPFPLTSIFA
jgi:hypothetical protein